MTTDVDVAIARGLRSRLRREIARMVRAAARSELVDEIDVTVRLSGDAVMRQLNLDYTRDKQHAMSVRVRRPAVFGEQGPAGDIVISVSRANQATYGLHAELLRLVSCGLCRLLGYEGGNEHADRAMNNRAAALRRQAMRPGRVRAAWSPQPRAGEGD